MVKDCIFCKIIKGEIPSAKIWEDKDFLAILDGYPNTKGMTLVLTKKHYHSYIFDMPKKEYLKYLEATKKVSKMLLKSLKVQRVAMVMEGMGINHAHIKLYPLHGLKEKFKETWTHDTVFFDNYKGYISTQLGPKADFTKQKKLAEQIIKANK